MGVAATYCSPRQIISSTGILSALWSYHQHQFGGSNNNSHNNNNNYCYDILTPLQVEFCHMALLAEEYCYAASVMAGTWPRPDNSSKHSGTKVTVRHVLRYYFLRGRIHIGCNDWTMAKRCFWTVLSIPSEVITGMGVAAWKLLVLVQCLSMDDDDYRYSTATSLTTPTEYAKTNPLFQQQQQHHHQQQQQQNDAMMMGGGSGFSSILMGGPFAGTNTSSSRSPAIMDSGPLSLPKAISTCYTRFLNAATE